MNEQKIDFEAILLENLRKLGFLESHLHPLIEDEYYDFKEYNRLKEESIPSLGLTIARIKGHTKSLILINSSPGNDLYKFKTSFPIAEEMIVPTLESYLASVKSGLKYSL